MSRDDFVRYQESYVKHHDLDVELGTTVERVERKDDGWRVTTSKGAVDAHYVVIGTGFNNVTFVPTWPGRDQFTTEIIHSKDYRSGAPYKGKKVLVVGTGNSGAEIATDLAENGAEVWWSFRTPPTILPRATLGIATQVFGVLLRPLSPKIVDPILSGFGQLTVGNLRKFGLPRPTRGGYTGVLRDHVVPILDVGIVGQIRRGHVVPVPTIASFDKTSVEFTDGQRRTPDAVVACTGFGTALEPILGHLGVLDKDGMEHGRSQLGVGGILRRRFDRRPGGRWAGGWWFGTEVDVEYETHEVFRHDRVGWRRDRVPACPRGRPIRIRPDWVCDPTKSGISSTRCRFFSTRVCRITGSATPRKTPWSSIAGNRRGT